MAQQPEHEQAEELGLERIVFFSDAVIAIAITLLAIDIRLPELAEDAGSEGLVNAVLALWPRYLSFVLSFVAIGSYWRAHHRIFRVVRRYDERLIWLNLLFLLCIAFIPFATSVMGEHGDEPVAATFYAVCIAITGLAEAVIWMYAVGNHRLVAADLNPAGVRWATWRSLLPPVAFLVSIPLIWINPYLGIASWFVIFFVTATMRTPDLHARH